MKVKLGQIAGSVEALNKVAQQPMKATASYQVAKNLKSLSDELAAYEQSRGDLIRKYGKENKEDNSFSVDPNSSDFEKFQKEFSDLLSVEVDLENFKKIKLSELSDCELTPQDITNIEFAIEE